MARKAAAGFWSQVRAGARTARRCLIGPSWLAAALVLIGSTLSGVCQAPPVKGEAAVSVGGGYARLVLKLAEDVESEVTAAGSIIVIRFKRAVDIPVDRLYEGAPDYIASARRDPDGSAIRLSTARKVTINTMTAGERVFVDLLPDGWSGQLPGLPPEVVSAPLPFGLADAQLAGPSNMASISQKIDGETSLVEVKLIGDVDVHSFREEKNYIIDVGFQQTEKPSTVRLPMADASHAPAPIAAVPVAAAAAAPERPARETSPLWKAGGIVPP